MLTADPENDREQKASSGHNPGQLVVVGTGIQWWSQTTLAARGAIQLADQVLFAVADPWAARWIRELSPGAQSLPYPRDGQERRAIYRCMVDRIIGALKAGGRVCAVFYGCPAVLTQPAHDAIRRARAGGYLASMLAGVSFLDCLFADLAVDPGDQGCQVLEAGDFLVRKSPPNVHGHLVLCQIGMVGNRAAFDPDDDRFVRGALTLLGRRLRHHYSMDHEAVIYEAARQPGEQARVERIRLAELADARVSGISTLYIPPLCQAPFDQEMLRELAALRLASSQSPRAGNPSPAASNEE